MRLSAASVRPPLSCGNSVRRPPLNRPARRPCRHLRARRRHRHRSLPLQDLSLQRPPRRRSLPSLQGRPPRPGCPPWGQRNLRKYSGRSWSARHGRRRSCADGSRAPPPAAAPPIRRQGGGSRRSAPPRRHPAAAERRRQCYNDIPGAGMAQHRHGTQAWRSPDSSCFPPGPRQRRRRGGQRAGYCRRSAVTSQIRPPPAPPPGRQGAGRQQGSACAVPAAGLYNRYAGALIRAFFISRSGG